MISLDQMVHQEAFVRIIEAFVNAIDISSFGSTNSEHCVEVLEQQLVYHLQLL